MGPTFQEFSNFWKILRKRKNLTGRVHHDVAMASWWPNPRRRRPQRRCVRASREARLGASGAPRRGLPVGGGAAASAVRSVAGDVETRRWTPESAWLIPCMVLVINDNLYGLMFALSYICRCCPFALLDLHLLESRLREKEEEVCVDQGFVRD